MDTAHALVVGIAAYQCVQPLPSSVANDARDIYEILIDPAHCGFRPENIRLIVDSAATRATLRQALAELAIKSDRDVTVLIYLSGHGGRIEAGAGAGEYLLPVDTLADSPASLAGSAISGTQLTAALAAIPARKLVVIFDCCHAGGIGQLKGLLASQLKAGLPEQYYEALAAGRGRAILASSRDTELSWILPGGRNSLFTTHLLGGLRGGAAGEDGLIRIFDLFEYLQPRVTIDEPRQHPVFKAHLEENFPVALYLGGTRGVIAKREEGFRYDAYISYVDNEPDAIWIWDILVPRLEDAGLRIAVSGDVEAPGVARVIGIERGIAQAKRTVVALSPTYLENGMAGFENVLAQTMGISERRYRLLPVKIAEINERRLPTRLSMLTTLDLTHPQRADQNFERLIEALQGPLPSQR